MESVVLRKDIQSLISAIGAADILVGIPSFNNAKTIRHVVKAVQAGFAKYFPDKKCVLVNSDGGSTDGTMEVVQNAVCGRFSGNPPASQNSTCIQNNNSLSRHTRQGECLQNYF